MSYDFLVFSSHKVLAQVLGFSTFNPVTNDTTQQTQHTPHYYAHRR